MAPARRQVQGLLGLLRPWSMCQAPVYRLLHRLLDALHAEMMACLKAIEFAADVGMGCIITKTDAYVLLVALQSNEYDASRHGGEIPLVLWIYFDFEILQCKHVRNLVAHALATLGAHMAPGATL